MKLLLLLLLLLLSVVWTIVLLVGAGIRGAARDVRRRNGGRNKRTRETEMVVTYGRTDRWTRVAEPDNELLCGYPSASQAFTVIVFALEVK